MIGRAQAKTVTRVTSLDTLLAYKAICLMDHLSPAERRVLAAIIDHFNRKDGECDPSIDRLAKLLGLHRRTILRAVERLDETRLIVRVVHGGKHQRNSYEPAWPLFQEVEKDWSAAMKRGRKVANLSADRWRSCRLTGGEDATQTYSRNLSSKPVSLSADENDAPHHVKDRERKWQARQKIAQSKVLTLQSTSVGEAADASNLRRWDADVRTYFEKDIDAYAAVVELIDINLQKAATAAERKRYGNGLRVILDHIRKTNPALLEGEQLGVAHEGDGSSQAPLPVAGISHPDNSLVRLSETRPDNHLTNLTIKTEPSGDDEKSS